MTEHEQSAEFSGMRLLGYAPVIDHGFALPCFRRGGRDNTWYVAVCSIPGDHSGTITDFDPFTDEKIVPLTSDVSREVGRGDLWCDVFLWDGANVVGEPSEIWNSLEEQREQIARLAPITLLDLAVAADRPERKELTRNAFLILTERYGSPRAVRWRDETFLRQVLLTRLRRFVSTEHLPEFERQSNGLFLTAAPRGKIEVSWPPTLSDIGLDHAATSAVAELNYLTSLMSVEVRLAQTADFAVNSGKTAGSITAKIVLLGDSGVGKSSLANRLIHGSFKEMNSTHGQQYWVYPDLGHRRTDGTECEAILWDFAGQPDYRLLSTLFMDDVDLALLVFDAGNPHDPLGGVEFWVKQLRVRQRGCPIILVAAQTDRRAPSLTKEELEVFCQAHGIESLVATSARTGVGLAELIERMKSTIRWDQMPTTITTVTFKRIKDYLVDLEETGSDREIIISADELRTRLEVTDPGWRFTDAEMMTAVTRLEKYGFVRLLRTSNGEQRVLLRPERLNNLASSLVLEARRNPKGLGALEEKRLFAGGYDVPELKNLRQSDYSVLLDSAVLLFLEHNLCFREMAPLRAEPYLVFPALINLTRPTDREAPVEDGVSYTVSGATENLFASLVVLLGYTHTFARTMQWHNNALYETGDGLLCGFRQEARRDGELDFVLSFGPAVGPPVRTLFQGLFESFLARRNLTVMRFEPVRCTNADCRQVQRATVVREWLKEGKRFAFCSNCGSKLALPPTAEPIQLTRDTQTEVASQSDAAEQRTSFEQAMFLLKAYVIEQKITPPQTFISYAWGVPEEERWVEKQLATDLQKAGIDVLLDRWYNAQVDASVLNVSRFVERIETSERIVMVGTPAYRRKYENRDSSTGYVVAAEVDHISDRLIGTEEQKESVLPLLLAGDKTDSLPPLLQTRVHADFREKHAYFAVAFDLILSLYRLPPNHPAVADLRELLGRGRVRANVNR